MSGVPLFGAAVCNAGGPHLGLTVDGRKSHLCPLTRGPGRAFECPAQLAEGQAEEL